MQTILGGTGPIGTELAKSLKKYTQEIRLVSRNPSAVNPGDETMAADLLDPEAVDRAVKDSSVVYVTLGFKYDIRVWKASWPPFIRSVLDSCINYGSKLLFFDNIYMYDPDFLHDLTEETPYRPVSKKGAVRAGIARMIMEEVEKGRLNAIIARCADYYGAGIQGRSMLTELTLKPLAEGKKAMWMSSVQYKHSYTYVPDAGKATALLGNSEDAFNQVWHLPTAQDPPTGKEWIEAFASRMNVNPGYRILTKPMARLIGIFVPVMRELPEMMYQYDRDYVFNSTKFDKRFGIAPTPYQDGINAIAESDYS